MSKVSPAMSDSAVVGAARRPGPDRSIRWSTTAAVVCVAVVAAIVSYRHAYVLARDYGEDGPTAWLVPLTVDGLIFASSMVLLQSARRQVAVPRLARWLLGLGVAATLAANAPMVSITVRSALWWRPGRRSRWWARTNF